MTVFEWTEYFRPDYIDGCEGYWKRWLKVPDELDKIQQHLDAPKLSPQKRWDCEETQAWLEALDDGGVVISTCCIVEA